MRLSVEDLSVHYGRIAAVRGVSFEVGEGEAFAIIGANGAGKTSTLQAIAGGRPASGGTIRFGETILNPLSPEARARLGLSLVPEGREVFGSLTVEENLLVATAARRDRSGVRRDLDRLLDRFPVLRHRLHSLGQSLSGGEQQQLVICRALMTRPRLLLIDEPSLGLAPQMVDTVYDILAELRAAEGLTLLVVEQSLDRVLEIADRVAILETGGVQRIASRATLRAELAASATSRQAAWSLA
ncbi:ABC transporter ATP-binding protein [Kaistia sp. 32K]|uniref:ABC transporter ATP-binding protein n=1 Tax=Kaistia sp. 32K TaxID=2795690 RepID=UPI0019151C91|nr:ABC transporter ATP-binding protein [Kaistia sp. 32K]BCP52221.1 ABC transporter ATP-binding protein [Kaistia sp. 32K]